MKSKSKGKGDNPKEKIVWWLHFGFEDESGQTETVGPALPKFRRNTLFAFSWGLFVGTFI